MKPSPRDLDAQWEGLEPEQPRSSRAAFWVALLAALLLLIGVLALGAFVLNQRGDVPLEDTAVVVPEATPTDVTTLATGAATSPPAIAATATLPNLASSGSMATAVRLAEPPRVDADLSEWSGAPTTLSEHLVFSAPGWDGSDDLSASWQLAWDADYLYVALAVVDDIHAQDQTGNQIFRGDSVDIQLDTNRTGDYGPTLSPDDFQITISPGNFVGLPPSAFLFQGTLDGKMLDAPGLFDVLLAARPQNGGYVLEAAIPWGALNVVPSPGLELGLALNASDNDQPGTAAQEMMKSSVASRIFSDPTSWGTLTLQ